MPIAPATPAATTMPVAHPLLPTPAAPIAYTLEFHNIEAGIIYESMLCFVSFWTSSALLHPHLHSP